MQRGFLLGGLMVVPFILLMGLFGLAWVAMEPDGEASVALFALVMPNLPAWVALAFIPLGLALVMSSADTAISAITSIIAVDGARLLPQGAPYPSAAAAFPVFLGLYSRRHDGVDALVATLAGLAAGLWMFPRPG